ncbi:MAG: lipase family protein [Aquisalimonadaceae bacterium]
MADYFSRETILRTPPIARAAYSDRTAWILAEVCRLVYEPLPPERNVVALIRDLRQAVRDGVDDDALSGLIRRAVDTGAGAETGIEEVLRRGRFELVDAFCVNGTEGVIIKLGDADDFKGMLVVAFRGTQPSIVDAVTDLKANLVGAPGGGRVHAGFLEAFQRVETHITKAMAAHQGSPVYFTGHSLGGALAMIATRCLGADGTGATYTFGCPRVADDDFYIDVKTPVYRLVNAADGVPRIPFGYGLTILLTGLRVIPINGTFRISEWIRKRFAGYTHFGDLVFLRPTIAADLSSDGRNRAFIVKRSPNIFWRMKTVMFRWLRTRGRAAAADHSMEQYALKLGDYAEWRNRERR